MKRIYVNVTEEQHDALKARAKRLGSTVSEEIRRAVASGLTFPAPRKVTTDDGRTFLIEHDAKGVAMTEVENASPASALLAYESSRCSSCGSEQQKASE
jgi:hypothetical protein